ncbi:hypothetical protein BH10ACI3_BH10ACI3_26310 [soil metagenome]
MALTNAWVQPYNKLPNLFEKIRDGQAPDRFTQQLLKDWGFNSTKDRAFIPLLKALNFLTDDGKPTQRYNDYRDHSRSKKVLGKAIRDAYGDIFLIKSKPTKEDRVAVEGKFKSFHNTSDNTANFMAKTFLALVDLADISDAVGSTQVTPKVVEKVGESDEGKSKVSHPNHGSHQDGLSLHYNIEIHLPPTKDVEVYNAIFKSLREHLLER